VTVNVAKSNRINKTAEQQKQSFVDYGPQIQIKPFKMGLPVNFALTNLS
jgi:hypothetical protein